jgi:hypothetical protein
MSSRYMDRHDTEQEETELEEKRLHEEGNCPEYCPYCADDEEQMSKDVDELVDHVNKELDKK